MGKLVRFSIIGYVLISTLFSASITVYNFLVYGPNDYSHFPNHPFFVISYFVGWPGSVIMLLVAMGYLVYFVCAIGNWIIFGEFKYFLKD